ncbi:2'-5' RNA ligase family protein [Deinococcus sp.]|uniref:2'-5' RNA ligase family protein n=1 Tax=Deinococcus sp. TaxID=47478 RepID=UPI003CC5953D
MSWQAARRHVVTAPHVTLKAPGPLSAAQQRACREAAERFGPFELELGGPQTFGERVISLRAGGEAVSRLHAALVAAVGDPPGEFELGGYHPHLTLALAYRPLLGGWADALASARAEFADLDAQPLRFAVQAVALFYKDKPGQPYEVVERWMLEGG